MESPKGAFTCSDPMAFELTDEMKESFGKYGYILVRGLLGKEEMDQIRKEVIETDAISQNTYKIGDGEGRIYRMALWRHPGNDATGILSRMEKVAGTCEKLLGGEVYHYHSKLMCKEAFTGGRFNWHQDYGYWYDMGCLFPQMMSVFFPIDPCTRENGCLEVLEGSHQAGRIEHGRVGDQVGAQVSRVEQLKARCSHLYLEMQPGDVLFFHCNLLHTTAPNPSPHRRWALISAYCRADNNPIVQHVSACYTPLHKMANTALRDCSDVTDTAGKEFLTASALTSKGLPAHK